MKKLVITVALALGLAGAAAADPLDGTTWKTQPDDGAYAYVEMYPCAAKVCGKIVRTFNEFGEYQSPNLGKKLVIDMQPNGDGSYNGKVWQPSKNKIYIGKMAVSGNAIKLKGCVAGGLICKAQDWVRLN